MFRFSLSGLGLTTRLLPVVGLFAAFVSVAPALAAGPAIVRAPISTPAGLAVSQTTSGLAVVGAPLTYTITVTNTTSAAAIGIFLGDRFPAGAKLVGPLATPDLCGRRSSLGFTCFVGNVAAGQSSSISFTLIPSTRTLLNRVIATGLTNGGFVTSTADMVLSVALPAVVVHRGHP